MPRLGLLPLLLAVLVVAACGATEESEPEPRAISAQQVAERFEEDAGQPVEPTAVHGAAWAQLGYGLDPSPGLVRRFGVFNVYVVEPGNDQALESLLSDKATGKPLRRDERGIYWELDSQSGTWIAHARYGPNVVLTWFSESKRKTTDARWERLDRILRGLDAAA